MQTVTDLDARHRTILQGHHVADCVHVFIVTFLGELPDASVRDALTAVHRVSADFFDRTPLTVHVLALLPDLLENGDREERYGAAFRQIAALDALGVREAALGFRSTSSVDYRWLIDCRSRTGAHAGGIAKLIEPIAVMVAEFLEQRPERPIHASDEALDRLRGVWRDRATAYSTLGIAEITYEPWLLVRYLEALATSLNLTEYLDEDSAHRYTEAPPPSVHAVLEGWDGTLRQARERLVVARYWDVDPREDPDLKREQSRHRDAEYAALVDALGTAVRNWLATGNLPRTRFLLETLLNPDAADVKGSDAALRADLQRELYAFLEIDEWRALAARLKEEIDALTSTIGRLRQEMLDADEEETDQETEHQNAAISAEEARREALRAELEETEAELARRLAVLDLGLSPEELEEQLRAMDRKRPFGEAKPGATSTQGDTEPSEGEQKKEGWFKRIASRFSGSRRSGPSPDAEETVPKQAPLRRTPPWILAERWRWILSYRGLLQRSGSALDSHEGDVESALNYYTRQHVYLHERILSRTPFRTPVVQPKDLEVLRGRYLDRIRAELRGHYGWVKLAARWALVPDDIPEFKTRFLERLPGLDEASTSAAVEVAGSLADERLADALAGSASIEVRYSLLNWIRAAIEGSEPLLRSEWRDPDLDEPDVERWLVATPALRGLLEGDALVEELLHSRNVNLVAGSDESRLTFLTTIHGFAGHEFRKLIPLRMKMHAEGDAPLEHDPISPSAGRVPPGGDYFDLLVIAEALGRIRREDGGYRIGETFVPGDLRDLSEEVCHSPALKMWAGSLRQEVDLDLQKSDATARLRAARELEGRDEAEKQILLELVAELEAQQAFRWTN